MDRSQRLGSNSRTYSLHEPELILPHRDAQQALARDDASHRPRSAALCFKNAACTFLIQSLSQMAYATSSGTSRSAQPHSIRRAPRPQPLAFLFEITPGCGFFAIYINASCPAAHARPATPATPGARTTRMRQTRPFNPRTGRASVRQCALDINGISKSTRKLTSPLRDRRDPIRMAEPDSLMMLMGSAKLPHLSLSKE